VDVEVLGQLRHRSVALDGGKRHLSLEGRGVVPARSSAHGLSCSRRLSPLSGRNSTYRPVQISGAGSPAALRAVRKGGRVVCAGIHMSDIPSFPYNLLWQERQLVSVANLTRRDGLDFLKIAPQAGIQTETTAFPLVEANDVLTKLRTGQLLGAAVLKP
jgi:threonine dehydrogenase-like Zn-dependent dehydrogenase